MQHHDITNPASLQKQSFVFLLPSSKKLGSLHRSQDVAMSPAPHLRRGDSVEPGDVHAPHSTSPMVVCPGHMPFMLYPRYASATNLPVLMEASGTHGCTCYGKWPGFQTIEKCSDLQENNFWKHRVTLVPSSKYQ